jgi:predicted ester cyclase
VWRLQAQDYAHLTDQDVIEDQDAVTIRTRNEGTHTGAFLGVPATGRRGAWDNTSLVHTRDGRIVGQWVQPDLWGIYQQITAPTPEVPRSVAAEPPVEWALSAR